MTAPSTTRRPLPTARPALRLEALEARATPDAGLAQVAAPIAADVDGDGAADLVSAAGPTGSFLRVVSGRDGADLVAGYAPYEAGFAGGLNLAAADLDGDGRAEVVTAPKAGGAARIQVFSLAAGGLVQRDNFFAFPDDKNYRGGASVAAGDVDDDGRPDLAVGAGAGGGPRVAVLDGRALLANAGTPARLVADFFAFGDPGYTGGVSVALGDMDGDGKADLATGAGAGGGPRVVALSGAALVGPGPAAAAADPLADLLAGPDDDRGGVEVRYDPRSGSVEATSAAGADWSTAFKPPARRLPTFAAADLS